MSNVYDLELSLPACTWMGDAVSLSPRDNLRIMEIVKDILEHDGCKILQIVPFGDYATEIHSAKVRIRTDKKAQEVAGIFDEDYATNAWAEGDISIGEHNGESVELWPKLKSLSCN